MKNTQQEKNPLTTPLIEGEQNRQLNQKSRRNRAGLFSKLFFVWVYSTIEVTCMFMEQKAQKVTLENHMIEDLKYEDTSEQLYYSFLKKFTLRKNEKNGLLWSLVNTSRGECLFVLLVMLVNVGCQLTSPYLIKLTIEYLMNQDKDTLEGIYLIVSIIVVRMASVICAQHAFYKIRTVGYDWMSILSMALLGKSMNVSYQSNKEHSSGQVLNYMQVDAMKLQWIGWYMSQVMLMPLQIGISIYMMFEFIGISFLGGLGVILLTAVFNIYVSKKMMEYQIAMMKDKDKRTQCANEIFQQIKFIKVNAYEEFFRAKLTKLRNQEIKTLKTRFFMSCLNVLSVWISPMLILNATFLIFVGIGNDLTPANTFAIISLFQNLQGPLLFLPMALNGIIDGNASFRRIQNFLLTGELMDDCIKNTSQSSLQKDYLKQLTSNESKQSESIEQYEKNDQQLAIKIDNGTFYWSKYKEQPQQPPQAPGMQAKKQIDPLPQEDSEPILRDLSIKIKKGEFISIVGDVGSGKSSLIQAILGEMLYKSSKPNVQINGTIAYVSQKAWIQNATVKDNIVFGLEFNEQKYNDAIKYSCLKEDLKILIKGDQTMIGEKGVNLSGGQKARVTLARAIYSESDIYLLDDPISAVDVHVGKQIIFECLNGYLQQKTRILITHALNYCQYTDYIYLMDNGKIVEQGTFQQIKLNDQFKKVYQKFYKNVQEEEEQPQQEIVEDPKKLELVKKQSSQQEAPKEPLQKDEVDELMLLEDRNKGNINISLIGQYIKLTGGVSFTILMFLVLTLWGACYVGAALWMAYWTKSVSDDILDNKETNNYFYLAIYVALSISSGIIVFLRSWAFVVVSSNSANRLHNKMISCLMYAPQCQFFERVPQGRIMNRLTKDQNTLDSELHWMINWTLIQVFMLIANSFLNIYTSSLWVLLPMLLYFILCWKIQRVYMTASRELFRMEAISKSPILSYFSESIMGITIIRAFQRQKQIMHKHGVNQDLNRKIFLEQIATNQWFGLVLGLSSFIVNTTAIVFCMFYSTQNPAYAGLLMTYASTLDQNINGTVQCLGQAENGLISFERCVAYTHVKPEKGYEKAVKKYQNGEQYKDQYIANWPSNGVIQYKNFSVQYREGLPLALKNMNLQINPREKVGIVGRTGAGKSTITLTILRILEAINGQLLIDDQDIQTLSLRQLRESITMIMQDPTLFEGTLRDNIDPLKLRTDDEIKEAINKCCLSELIEQRNGLETIIKDHGDNLSAGEKQLVCIARAVLKKSPIVLIDEATANIDIDTEHKIQETIQNAFKECTVITIAHRINTILHCDKILVLDKGEVREFGYTKDLLNQTDSLFYGIYQEALREQKQ